MAAPKVTEDEGTALREEVAAPVVSVRERLFEVANDTRALQAKLDGLMGGAITNVPSLAQVLVWAHGQLERV